MHAVARYYAGERYALDENVPLLLLIAAALVALSWLMLVVASGFSIWTTESNLAGLTLQIGLILFPVALFIGLKLSKHSVSLTNVLFASSWFVASAALVFGLL